MENCKINNILLYASTKCINPVNIGTAYLLLNPNIVQPWIIFYDQLLSNNGYSINWTHEPCSPHGSLFYDKGELGTVHHDTSVFSTVKIFAYKGKQAASYSILFT